MKVYIDFDDVLCETAKHFTKLAKELFGIDVPYRQVQFFNLKKTFDLSDEQYEEMMIAGHLPENLLNYEETTGAADTINKWVDEGHEIYIITGRPFNSSSSPSVNYVFLPDDIFSDCQKEIPSCSQLYFLE